MAAVPTLSQEEIREVLDSVGEEDLMEMAHSLNAISRQLDEEGPQTDDELWVWVKQNLGIEIARASVCKGHDAPFKLLADAYFCRHPAILAMGNRGGGKTFLVALLHWLNSEFKPGYESCSFGATEAQSLRCYAHLRNWVMDDEGNRKPQILSSVMRETKWRSGSKVEVLAGTEEAVNGPHSQTAHGDEIELMKQGTWEESRNIAQSKVLPTGRVYESQEVLTSTRKSLHGRMQSLIDDINNAVKQGKQPTYKLVIWCIFEVAQEVPCCQMVSKEDREARLKELGEKPTKLCECDQHMKGRWPDDGKPRLLNEVCKGRLFRSRGHLPYSDVVQKFKQNSIYTWEAQQECTKPETEFNYLRGFSEERHGIKGFEPDPQYGEIYMSVDWGGTNPHAVNWYQLLDREVEVHDFYNNPKVLPVGCLVAFDEIYIADIGVGKLIPLVKRKEQRWRKQYPGWEIKARFPDPQGSAARKDFKDAGLVTIWRTTRDFETQIEWLQHEWWDNGLIVYSIERCELFPQEAMSWQRDPVTGKEIDEFQHCMSNLRYATANIRTIKRRQRRQGRGRPTAKGRLRTSNVVKDTRRAMSDAGPVGVRSLRRGPEDWRRRLGGPGL